MNEQGQISYTDEEGKTHTLLPDGKHDEDNSCVLKTPDEQDYNEYQGR